MMPHPVNTVWHVLTAIAALIRVATIGYFIYYYFDVLSASHWMVWQNSDGLLTASRVLRQVIILSILSLVGVFIESSICFDYINEKSISYDSFLTMKAIFVFLLFQSSIVFASRWWLFIRVWAQHSTFFIKHRILDLDEPTPIFLLNWTITLLLHKGVYK